VITFVSEIVERKLYPSKLRFADGEVFLELSNFDRKLLDTGFYLPKLPAKRESELVYVKLDDLQFDVIPAYLPAGFIYHLGRCGSTVTVKMLNSLENYQVISEATIFHEFNSAQMYKPIDSGLERRKKLVDLFCLLGESENCKTVFKMASWEVRVMDEYSKLYPEVKSCLIVRNILEIMVAVLKDPPSRLRRNHMRRLLEQERSEGGDVFFRYLAVTFGTEIDYFLDQTFVDFIAGALQTLLKDAKNTTSPFLVIDHRDIVKRVPTELCALFGIKADKQQIQMMQQRASYNSKSRNQKKDYTDDSDRKTIEATPEIRAWCDNVLQPLLEDILKMSAP